jgi:hypothetical protein
MDARPPKRDKVLEYWVRYFAKRSEKFDPDQPRDEDGKWTDGGGGGDSGGGEKPSGGGKPEKPSEGQQPKGKPKLAAAKGVSTQAKNRVQSAVDAIPATHAERLKNVPVDVLATNRDFAKGGGAKDVGLFSWHGGRPMIEIPQSIVLKGKSGQEYTISIKNIEHNTVHELGHALDHSGDWKEHSKIYREMTAGIDKMTKKEQSRGQYYISDPRETFAELYAVAHNPKQTGTQRYFGGMKKERVEEVFKDALIKVRAIP